MSELKISEQELAYWLVLWRMSHVGPKRFQTLLAESNNQLSAFFENKKPKAQLIKLLSPKASSLCFDWQGVEKDLRWLNAANNHHIITLFDARYPQLLKEVVGAPPLIVCKR